MFPYGDRITITRLGVFVANVGGGVDPAESRLLLDFRTDIQAGDHVEFRGRLRRINATPLDYRSPFTGWEAGRVAYYDPDPPYLPDLAELRRPNGVPVVDETTGTLTTPPGALVWSGPCKVTPGIGEGTNPDDLATQSVTAVNHVVSVPLTLSDVLPEDQLLVTQSRDTRLMGRTLVVVGIRLTSEDLVRQLLCRDTQG